MAHVHSPFLPNGAKEVIIDALCHDCGRDLCANYFDSRVIIIGRVSHNYGFAFHSYDMICLNGVLIVCKFDRLLDVQILTCKIYGEEVMIWGKLVTLCLFLPPSLANQFSHGNNNCEIMNGSHIVADYTTTVS